MGGRAQGWGRWLGNRAFPRHRNSALSGNGSALIQPRGAYPTGIVPSEEQLSNEHKPRYAYRYLAGVSLLASQASKFGIQFDTKGILMKFAKVITVTTASKIAVAIAAVPSSPDHR